MTERTASPERAHRLGGFVAMLLCAQITRAHCADPVEHQDIALQVGILVEHIDVDAGTANTLIREIDDGEKLRSAVDIEIAAGRAKITETAYLLAQDAYRARMVTAHEFIYPTSWDPAELPQNLKGHTGPASDLAVPASATAFEMESVGHFLDFAPMIPRSGERPRLATTIHRVSLKGFNQYGDDLNRISQPTFEVMKLSRGITQIDAKPSLLAATTPKNPRRNGRVDLTFVRIVNEHVPIPTSGDAEPFKPQPKADLSTIVELIEFDRDLCPSLFLAKVDPESPITPYQILTERVRRGEAKSIASTLLRTKSGNRAKGGAGSEFIYGTENDPSQLPQNLTSPPADRSQFTVPISPTAFDSRKLGLTVEAVPSIIGDGSQIDLKVAIERCVLDREQVYGQDEGEVKQPIFSSTKITTGVVVRAGTDQLLAITTPREPRSGDPIHKRRIAIFVRVDRSETP
jgi:hypothetical protein